MTWSHSCTFTSIFFEENRNCFLFACYLSHKNGWIDLCLLHDVIVWSILVWHLNFDCVNFLCKKNGGFIMIMNRAIDENLISRVFFFQAKKKLTTFDDLWWKYLIFLRLIEINTKLFSFNFICNQYDHWWIDGTFSTR